MSADAPGTFRSLLPHVLRHRAAVLPSFAGILFLSALHSLAVFAFPFLNRAIFDTVIPTLDGSLLARISAAILLLVAFGAAFKFLIDAFSSHLRTLMMGRLRGEGMGILFRSDFSAARRLERGDTVQSLMGDTDAVAEGIVALCKSGAGILQLAGVVAVLGLIDPRLLGMACLAVGSYAAFSWPFRKAASRLSEASSAAVGAQYGLAYEMAASIKAIKCDNLESFQHGRFAASRAALSRTRLLASLAEAYDRLGTVVPARAAFLFLLVFGFFRMREGGFGIGQFATLFWFTDIVLDSASRLRASAAAFFRAGASAARLERLLAIPREADGSREMPPLRRGLAFHRIAFSHAPGRRVLAGVDLEIGAGSRVGIAGASGSGKSTLLDILAGLANADEGGIRADGAELGLFTASSRRRRIAFVPQDPFLFNDTIRRNIDVSGSLDPEALARACRMACLDGLIARSPRGLDTPVGESGARLSGGERQRVALARALASGAAVLVLDEATSALDPETEARVVANLAAPEAEGGVSTLIMAAHRPEVLERMEAVHVFEGGRIAASGPYRELLREGPRFRDLMAAGGRGGHG